MEEILVSVIIPAYNCAGCIDQAVQSALMQDMALEVIVINDCSPDDLDAVMAKYSKDARVRYVKNAKNQGVAATRNRGVALAKGRYIAFLDADDIWRESKLSKQLACMEETGAVLCATARELMNPAGELSGRIFPIAREFIFKELCKQNFISCSSVVLTAEVAKEFPMGHDDAHEDYLLWMQILKKYGRGCGVNEPLLLYRLSNTGKSGSKWNSAKMTFKTYRYMGFGFFRSVFCFLTYTFHGIKKYYL